jgi:hypothetical protein
MNNQIIDDISPQVDRSAGGGVPRPVPNGDLVLVMGICSILFCMVYGVVGIACGWIGLSYFGKVKKLYEANPAAYTVESFNNAKAGKVCSIVGLCISVCFIIGVVIAIAVSVNHFS